MNNIIGSLNRLGRRIVMMVGLGRKTQGYGDVGPIQILQVQLGVDEVMDIQRMAEFGFSSMPPDGSSVIALFARGDHSDGVIIATGHIASRPVGLAPGESKLYSQDGKYVYMTASGGIIVFVNGQDVVINNARKVTINASSDVTVNCGGNLLAAVTGSATITAPNIILNGNVSVEGTIIASGNVTGNGISGDSHVHSGVETGDGTTGVPE